MREKPQNPIEDYATATWPELEEIAEGACPCCGTKYNPGERPDLTARCHRGPLFVSYWDEFLYLDCHKCHRPVFRVRVSKSLIEEDGIPTESQGTKGKQAV